MKLYNKHGKLNKEEEMILQSIERIIQEKGINPNQVPESETLDDLISVLKMLENEPKPNEAEKQAQTEHSSDIAEPNEIQKKDIINKLEDVLENNEVETQSNDSNSLKQEIRDNNQDELPDEISQIGGETSELAGENPQDFINEDYDPFAEPIIERSYNANGSSEKEQNELGIEGLNESSNTPLDDLNPRTKRKAAEQTANAILKTYSHIAPKPFKWLSKFPEAKIEKMAFKGELDVTIEVADGLSFDEYVKETNKQIDELFEVDEDTIEEIKEPLIEVLMEQDLELTPKQRLGMAIASHVLEMLTTSIQLWQTNKRVLEYQKHLTQVMASSRKAA